MDELYDGLTTYVNSLYPDDDAALPNIGKS